MTDFVEESFTNESGQVFHPGEDVIFAASTRRSVALRRGVFKGVRYDDVFTTEYLKDADGNFIMKEMEGYNGSKYYTRKTETKKTREVVAVVIEKVNRGKVWKWVDLPDGKKDYVQTDEDIYGKSILPLMRVYKLSTSLEEMAGTIF